MPVSSPVPALSQLAQRMREIEPTRADPPQRWSEVYRGVSSWVDGAVLRAVLRRHLAELDPRHAEALAARSRETTTHFAWCLRDHADEPFTFWLHEYKPRHEWRPGYADSVHNHRYHFCTVILRGGYRHERYTTTTDADTGLITGVRLTARTECAAGDSGFLVAQDFHRIPCAQDGTMTFLVKSRPVRRWSLSWDPTTGTGHRHVPVEARLGELTGLL
ncbi:hypothetical protein [Actinokineospora cianjurensis]|uniref:Cysteine dioxygenase type I n=1 Tax=Actinokineospora cianjurensis TaxID=585224 RepID=A0A421B4V0_9PSEU|nr:hypothetical protein [Actinokineospora cianjurensis]RLK59268.1 hypothetical protein CLV68_3753 [Actinokineospora cianjurensis]